MPSEGGSTRWMQVQDLIRRLEPRIIEMFRRYGLPPVEAGLLLEEVITLLLYRWGEVANPEAWLVELLEYRLERDRNRRPPPEAR